MRLRDCFALNFGSYKELTFDYENQDLTLIHGPTGSGKSTLQDLAAWALFGITAKNGSVDDVRNWAATDPTYVILSLDDNAGKTIHVRRKRGTASQNDLFWTEANSTDEKRGKDVNETQKLLEQRLGISADLYLTGAYFHEFSSAGSFFVAKAKERRAVFEQIANLSLPTKLSLDISINLKSLKAEIVEVSNNLDKHNLAFNAAFDNLSRLSKKSDQWEATKLANMDVLIQKVNNFDLDCKEEDKKNESMSNIFERDRKIQLERYFNQLEDISEIRFSEKIVDEKINKLSREAAEINSHRCDKCGSPTKSQEKEEIMANIHSLQIEKRNEVSRQVQINMIKKDIQRVSNESNPYLRLLSKEHVNVYEDQLNAVMEAINPYESEINLANEAIERSSLLSNTDEKLLTKKKAHRADLEVLSDLMDNLRINLVSNTIKAIEEDTNRRLEKFFDSEIKVAFEVQGLDKVEVTLQKNGYECSYKQLSKGQRGLLKLCFVTSLMKAAANNAGVHFGSLFLDEACDGLDSDLKVKAFSLFEELSTEHESVFLIDHSPELKLMFSNSYRVEQVEDESVITHE